MSASYLPFGRDLEEADWLHLGSDERVLWSGRPSRLTIAVSVIGGLLLGLAGIAATWWALGWAADAGVPDWFGYLPLLVALAGVGWAGYVYLHWLRLLYVLTDEEIYVKRGLVSRDVTQIRLDRVQNTTFEQSMVERVFRYGDVSIYTAGTSTDDVCFRDVPNPQRVAGILTDLIGEHSEERRDRMLSQGV